MRDLSELTPLAPTGLAAPGYEYLVARGIPAARLDTLIPMFDLRYDEQELRVVFPVRENGVDLGYTGRSIDPHNRHRWRSHPVEGGHKTVIYEPDRVLAGGDTLFVVEGPFDALMVTAAMATGGGGPGSGSASTSVATAFFGSLPTTEQLGYIETAVPLFRMVYLMLDTNVRGRCRKLAQDLAASTGASNVGALLISAEHRDPGAMDYAELQDLVTFAEASLATEVRWGWERRLIVFP